MTEEMKATARALAAKRRLVWAWRWPADIGEAAATWMPVSGSRVKFVVSDAWATDYIFYAYASSGRYRYRAWYVIEHQTGMAVVSGADTRADAVRQAARTLGRIGVSGLQRAIDEALRDPTRTPRPVAADYALTSWAAVV